MQMRGGWLYGAVVTALATVSASLGAVGVSAAAAAPASAQTVARARRGVRGGTVQLRLPSGMPHPRPPQPTPTTVPSRRPQPAHHVPAMRVVSLRPAAGATNVTTGTRLFVTLSKPPVHGAPMPVLLPPVAGKWTVQGRTLTFTPTTGYRPWSTERMRFPPGLAAGPSKPYSFEVGAVPVLRIQQALAELHYLPLRFGPTATTSALRYEALKPADVRTVAEPGVWSWRYPNIPASLAALWAPGEMTELTVGAVMVFEAHVGLPTDGVPGEAVWDALVTALAHRNQDTSPYDYLMVSENLPESLVVWQNGQNVFETPVNTGVPGAQTPIGTWPVYERFVTTTMAGTDPDGVSYDVSGIPWVAYFNGGDAVHGYWRSYFGYPQSNGCVELPISNAAVVWNMDPLGTLVTVLP